MAIITKNYANKQNAWILSVSACLGVFVIGFCIASIVILALIPVYLSIKTTDMSMTNPISVTYKSNMVDGNSLTLTKMTALTRAFGKALHLEEIIILDAKFVSSNTNSTRRKKRANDDDLFTVLFSIRYSTDCGGGNTDCQQQIMEKARIHITKLYTTFTLPISFTNGYSFLVQLSICAAPLLSMNSQCFLLTTDVCDAPKCQIPLTALQKSNRFTSTDYVRNLLSPNYWINTPGGNVSYFNLSTTPVLTNIGIALTLVMLEPCGVILPHTHPRGSKGIYMISGTTLQVGFIQENRAQLILNEIQVGYATGVPRGAIHFVRNLGCIPSMQIVTYNNEDPGLLTIGLNMFRFPNGPLSPAFGQSDEAIDKLRQAIPGYPLDVSMECRKTCGFVS